MKSIIYILTASITLLSLRAQDLPIFKESKRLGDEVNSKADEVKPILNGDGTIMYLTRARHEGNEGYNKRPQNQDIWESVKDENGNWSALKHEPTINDEWDNSIIGHGKGEHYFLLNTYQSSKDLDYGIAHTKKTGAGEWSKPEVMKVPKLKYDGTFYDFYITNDEQALIISIKGEDSRGEEDLYVSTNTDGNWSEPISLGNKINTTGFEMSPFLSNDKKYLFYSTNGRSDGMGGADVYVSERFDDTWANWSEPRNLGKEVNSEAMDCYFTISDNGDYYFSSDRQKETGLDIYQAIEYVEPEPISEPLVIAPITVEKIEETKVGEKLVLHNIQFELDKYELLQESFEDLDMLAGILKEKETLKVELSGHTSNEGEDDYNLKLSENRAKTVVDYLISKGAKSEQLISKGCGEDQPITSNETQEGKEENRRVELKMLEK